MKNSSYMLWTMICMSAIPLRAATQAHEQWGTYGGNGFFSWDSKGSTAYDAARRRSETERSRFFSSTPEQRIEIERVDLDKIWTIDPQKKRYTEASISEAREKSKKDVEKNRDAWEKKNKNIQKEKETEPRDRIRRVETKVTGPGAIEIINGFSCRPYVIKTVIDYESLPDHKFEGRQTLYSKEWTSDSPLLAQYRKDEMAYWQSQSEGEWNKQDLKDIQEAFRKELEKTDKDPSVNPLLSYGTAVAGIKGYPVRSISGFTIAPADSNPDKPDTAKSAKAKDENIVQPGDFSGGVGGLVGGIASRWVSKKWRRKFRKRLRSIQPGSMRFQKISTTKEPSDGGG